MMRAGIPVSSASVTPGRGASRRPALFGFTLAEVLAALLFMAIVIPVAMHGVSVASRAGILGQRKAQAIRVAERMLNEMIVTGETASANSSGSTEEGDTTFQWTMRTEPWPEGAMNEVTVTVSFEVQGNTYDVSLSTLIDPTAATTGTGSTGTNMGAGA